MKKHKKWNLVKLFIKIPLFIILGIIILLLLLYAGLSIYVEITDPIINPPSNEIKELLKDEKFYFMLGGSIYESKGVQQRATLVREFQRYDLDCKEYCGEYTIKYFLPVKSPNQRYLTYYKIHSYDQWGGCCSPSHLIQLEILDLETGEAEKIFDTETWKVEKLPDSMKEGLFKISDLSRFSIGWSNDSETLTFNFVDRTIQYTNVSYKRFLYDRMPRHSGLTNIDMSKSDICAYPYPPVCLENKDGRFQFFHEKREGLNSVWYIRGHDTVTDKDFRLTILGRAIYTE